MTENIKINNNNDLSYSKKENFELKEKQIFPNINKTTNLNNNYYNKNNNNQKDLESNDNKKYPFKKNYQSHSDLRNKVFDINLIKKKENLSPTEPIKNININKSNIDISSQINNKDLLLNSKSNKELNHLKDDDIVISNNNNNYQGNSDNNLISSHNNIMSDILIKTENFFNNLGVYLDENNKQNKNINKKKI